MVKPLSEKGVLSSDIESNRARFQAEWLHSDLNVVKVDSEIHKKINGHYSSHWPGTRARVRDLIAELPYEKQHAYGVEVLRKYGVDAP